MAKTHLATLEMQNQMDGKLDVLVEKVQPSTSGRFFIVLGVSSDFNGTTFTAKHKTDMDEFTAVADAGTCRIEVTKPGTYEITNDKDDQKQTVTIENEYKLTVTSFKATVTVTVPDELIGETIQATQDGTVIEQKAESTEVILTVTKEGVWNIGVKGNSFIKTTVTISGAGDTQQCSLTISSGVPKITVTTSNDIEGKTLKCTKTETVLQKVVKNKKVVFFVPETGEWQISCDDFPELTKNVNVEENQNYNVRYSNAHIYGVKVKQEESDPGTRVEYVEESIGMEPVTVSPENGAVTYNDWDQTWIFDKIYPVMLKKDGTVDYKLNPNDYSKKLEGGNSDITDINYEGNAMVCIEKMYIKFYEDAGYEYYLISDEPEDGFKPVGFTRADGTEMDQAYIAMFKGCYDTSNALRSISGKQIRNQTSYTDFRTAAQKNGTNYNLEPHGLITVLDAIYLILFKNEDSQTVCGRGRDYGTDDTGNHAMSIKTGILNTSGPIGYDPSSQGVKFMHIEDYWGNSLYFWMDGWHVHDSKVYVKFNQPYSDTSSDGYTEVKGLTPGSGYISKSIANTDYGRIPNGFDGSTSTYECDNASTNYAQSEIRACYRANSGVWYRDRTTVSNTSTSLGAALSYEPPSAT